MVEAADVFLTVWRIWQIWRFTYLLLPYKKKVLQLYFYKCWF